MPNTLDFSLVNAIYDKDNKLVDLLLSKGANVNAQINGVTPLVLASGFNEIEICRLLLKHGADPNLSPDKDTTPLITAASFGHCQVVRLLVEAGGDPELRDSEGLNAHYWASKSKCQNCCNFLLELKKNEAAFKKVHFSESLGSTSESSSSRISCLSEDQSKLQKCKPASKLNSGDHLSSPKSPLRLKLSPKDIAKLRSLLSPGNSIKKNLNLCRDRKLESNSMLQSGRLSSSTGNLTNISHSNQIFCCRTVTSDRNLSSSNSISPGLPPKSPRIRSPRGPSTRLPLSPPCRNQYPTSNSQLQTKAMVTASKSWRSQDEVPSIDGFSKTKGKRYFSGISLNMASVFQAPDKVNVSRPPVCRPEFSRGRYGKAVRGYSPFELASSSSDDEVSDGDTSTVKISSPSSCTELDMAFRKSSSEPRLSNQQPSDVDDDNDDVLLDKAFCEAFSGLCLINSKPKNEVKESTKGACNEQKALPKALLGTHGYKEPKSLRSAEANAPGNPAGDWSFEEILGGVERLADGDLRSKLMAFKVNPGPILKSTRRIYQLKLAKLIALKKCGAVLQSRARNFEPSLEVVRICGDAFERSFLDDLENKMSRPFFDPDPPAMWRQGTKKSCFNYLLLDPRITKNLPQRVKTIGQKKGFLIFVESIFYVGKGQKMRPYEHFKEASIHRSKFLTKTSMQPTSRKVAKILEIWKSGKGVISLCAFQNAIPVESLTREACMIEAIGLENLTNVRKGQLYGPASGWPKREVRRLGSWLLWKSFVILLNEGERQIRHKDVSSAGIS